MAHVHPCSIVKLPEGNIVIFVIICPSYSHLIGGLEHVIFHNIWDNPSHWLIFFRGVQTANQPLWLVESQVLGI